MGVNISRKAVPGTEPDLLFGQTEAQRVTKSHFAIDTFVKMSSTGNRFWKTKHRYTKKEILLTETPKIIVLNSNRKSQVLNELSILRSLYHPFIPNLRYAFHDRLNLFMGFDYVGGGTLATALKKKIVFNEFEAKFVTACILTAIEYLHKNNIMHANITTENLVFNTEGYIHLCDFKMAKELSLDQNETDLDYEDYQNDRDLSYSAPEFLLRKNIGKSIDYYSIGMVAYEMMVGNNPLDGKGKKEILKILNEGSIQVKKSDLPEEWSFDAADFVNRLIQRKPENRLGYLGIYQIKSHPWLKDFPWQKIGDKTLNAPYRPHNDLPKDKLKRNKEKKSPVKSIPVSFAKMTEKEKIMVERSQIYFEEFDYDFYYDSPHQKNVINTINQQKIPTALLGNMSKIINTWE